MVWAFQPVVDGTSKFCAIEWAPVRTEFITGDDVWPKLKELASSTTGPKLVASAYLGDRAGDLLALKGADVLVVALSEGNAKNGSVSPKEIQRLMRIGVEIFVDEHLHAKVYVFDDVVAVGSPNLSRHSEAVLHETLLVSREPAAVQNARAWFDELRAAPVTPDWLDHCLSVYKPQRMPAAGKARSAIEGRVWLVGVREMEFPEDEEDARVEGEEEAEAEVSVGYDTETLRFAGTSLFAREVKSGDVVIQVWKRGRSHRVFPHSRVLGVRRTDSRRGARVVYVYLEAPTDPRPSSWKEFRAEMAAVGLTLGRGVSTRELKAQRITARAKSLTRHV